MRGSPWVRRRSQPAGPIAFVARGTVVAASIFIILISPSAVADLTDSEPPAFSTPIAAPAADRVVLPDPATAAPVATGQAAPVADCPEYPADYCVEIPVPSPATTLEPETAPPCRIAGVDDPSGELAVVPETSPAEGDRVLRVRIEVERGLAIDRSCFAAVTLSILQDERGWGDVEDIGFAQVMDDSFDFRLILASPRTTNSLCYPAATGSKYSCRNRDKVVLNLLRWETGTDDFGSDLPAYRRYLVNHEVGHFLGRSHVGCPEPGAPAPVMMQQTKGVGTCLPNGWPTESGG